MRTTFALSLIAIATGGVAAEERVSLRPGSYEVRVGLELPHVERSGAEKSVTVCISDTDPNGAHGLAVLSDNNPLGKCAKSNARQDGSSLTFEVACDGLNAAHGHAVYQLLSDAFTGRIDMKMGGKNMTMLEVQTGKRVGDCEQGPHS